MVTKDGNSGDSREAPPSVEPTPVASIKKLRIERFRGVESLTWNPASGMNVILGGGDAGKTTILDAIGMLFSPTYPATLSDTDYYLRDIAAGFEIVADVSLPEGTGISHQLRPSWPWRWDGKDAVVPQLSDDDPNTQTTVYRLRVRGADNLELHYEILQPDGSDDPLSVSLRRSIGLVRLSGDDRNDRDLRMVQGSALDRLLTDKSLRSRIANDLAKTDVRQQLTADHRTDLEKLEGLFARESLPTGLDLAFTGSPGIAVTSMIGLTATRSGVRLPLTTWGSGTRRLSALAIAEQNHKEAPIRLVDEVERGLEPYRQRLLVEKLQAAPSQTFLTTHSPAVLAAVESGAFWYVDNEGRIGRLDDQRIKRLRKLDPNAFLSRVTIIGEGITEVGFAQALLERSLNAPTFMLGIHVADGGGHESTLGLLESLVESGLRFGGFADEENGKHPTRWARVALAQGGLLFRWATGCVESNLILAVSDENLELLVQDPDGEKSGGRLRSLADRLGIQDKSFSALRAAAGTRFRSLLVDAALGRVPTDIKEKDRKKELQAHAKMFFKSEAGGRELEGKLFALGLWPDFRERLLPFCNAVRDAAGLPQIADLSQQ